MDIVSSGMDQERRDEMKQVVSLETGERRICIFDIPALTLKFTNAYC